MKIITLLLVASTVAANAQEPQKRTNRFPVGTFHQKNSNINGISVGLYSGYEDADRNVHTNGIKLEPIGAGIILPLLPQSPISEDDAEFEAPTTPPSERINGFNLSPAGTACDCVTNGFSAGYIGQMNRKVNGASISVIMNITSQHNGAQLSMFNESYVMNGLQIGIINYSQKARGLQFGLMNKATKLKGLQLGLWNTNQKRKLPILNWNFRD
ncbi:MAG TPA: hypothetical protein VK541_18865 [Pedobacter sp.]|uniref:LA_2272 family surface repeat-containing protein n=1 Tax=Pedobacter sp. TaxID=1411316 RepID=UPI002C536337|nr:hypothetical protein [Pedobacter sp.]HMI04560.1 hypothetical protein [Pedobacter sp.]